MGEQSFTTRAAQTLDRLEADIERSADDAGVDLELSRRDNVIDIEFEDGSKVVINSHQAAGEIWVAARSGGYHFRPVDAGRWVDGRSGRELRVMLAEQLSAQAGRPMSLPRETP
jgi:CyaY protein